MWVWNSFIHSFLRRACVDVEIIWSLNEEIFSLYHKANLLGKSVTIKAMGEPDWMLSGLIPLVVESLCSPLAAWKSSWEIQPRKSSWNSTLKCWNLFYFLSLSHYRNKLIRRALRKRANNGIKSHDIERNMRFLSLTSFASAAVVLWFHV